MLTSVENVHHTHTHAHLQFATWGMGGCCCWKLFKLNSHRSEWTRERGERTPDEFIITLFQNVHTCVSMHSNTQIHTTTHTLVQQQKHVQRRWLSRAQMRYVLRPYRQRCPAFNRPSYSLPASLSLASLCFLSASPPLCHHSEKQNVKNTLASKHWFN